MTYQEWYLKEKWFSGDTPANPKSATIAIGSGDDGVVTVTYGGGVGTGGNDYSLEVVEGSGLDVDLTAELSGAKITVTLGTDGAGDLDATKNTATLIVGVIDAISGFSAVASGTGATALAVAIAEDNFSGGQYGTPCMEVNTLVYVSPYYYLCTTAGNKDDVAWKRFTPATY